MRLTWRGALALLAGAMLCAAGLSTGLAPIGVGGGALLASVAIAAATQRAPRAKATRLAPAHAVREDAPFDVACDVQVEAAGARIEELLPPELFVTEGTSVSRGAKAALRYRVTPRVPGVHRIPGVRVSAMDPLGLVERESILDVATEVVVLPRAEPIKLSGAESRRYLPTPGPHLVGQAGSGSEFFALRDYQDGDTMRDVNWRASARSGRKLIVNQREIESQATVTIFLDARAASLLGTRGDHAWMHALRAAASLAGALSRRRDRARVVAYGGAEPAIFEARAGDASQLSLLAPLAGHSPAGDAGLGAAVERMLARLPRRGACILVSTLLDDPSVPKAIASLRGLDLQVVVLELDGERFCRLAGEDAPDQAAARRRVEACGAKLVTWSGDEPLALALARGGLA